MYIYVYIYIYIYIYKWLFVYVCCFTCLIVFWSVLINIYIYIYILTCMDLHGFALIHIDFIWICMCLCNSLCHPISGPSGRGWYIWGSGRHAQVYGNIAAHCVHLYIYIYNICIHLWLRVFPAWSQVELDSILLFDPFWLWIYAESFGSALFFNEFTLICTRLRRCVSVLSRSIWIYVDPVWFIYIHVYIYIYKYIDFHDLWLLCIDLSLSFCTYTLSVR